MAAPQAQAQESNILETPQAITLRTDDGLSLTLNRSKGFATAMAIGERVFQMAQASPIRFEEVVEIPDAPDLLKDRGFQDSPAPWGMSPEAIEEGNSALAGRWLRVSGKEGKIPRRVVRLNQSQAEPLVLSGWCRAEMHTQAAGWMNSHLALNIHGTYSDGDRMPEQSAYFGQYDHGPQFNAKVLCPDKPLASVAITLTAPEGDCTAWYKEVTLKPARYRIISPESPCERIDARVTQDFAIEEASLRGLLTYQPAKEYIEIRCRFESQKKTDRALSVYLAIPFDAVGGLWHDDFRRFRKIESGRIYRNEKWYGAGRDGYDSRYPIACVESVDGIGLCLATAIDEPRVFQIEYDSAKQELRIRYDLGLSPDAGRWANRGSFTAYLFRYDTRDGFRGATEKYHRLFDWAFFNKRVDLEGLWLAFLTPSAIPGGWEDFHFQFVEAMRDIGWESGQGMSSLKYVEPWIHHHESPPHAPFEETRGPIDPQGAIKRAKKMLQDKSLETPPESRHRYAAFLGSYIEDNWGNPQGYFFRNPKGRNENMMIVNPNPSIPPPKGAHFTSGDFDNEVIREASQIWKQWHVDGWTLYRFSERPCLEVDAQQKASGRQSIRFDPIRSKSYWEQYVHGIEQTFYYTGDNGPFEFSFSARGENLPAPGTGLQWTVEFQSEEDRIDSQVFKLSGVDNIWRRYRYTLSPKWHPFAITIRLVNLPWFPDPSTIWIDDVRLTVAGKPENLVANGDFEKAQLLQGSMDGVYLDTMECYTNNLNYRRSHWPYAEEPLTFDAARKPALQQQFSHITYARRMAEWSRMRDLLLFGNCAPGTPFAAPYLDVMGGEEDWMPGGKWSPKSDADFNFVRFMCRARPFCLLQYADLDREHLERYIKRCVFYGVFPGNQSSSRTSGKWYWSNAVRVARDRPLYKKYMPVLREIAGAGWQPITLASADSPNLWLERFGAGSTLYLTVFNPTGETQSATLTLDPRSGMTVHSKVWEMIQGQEVTPNPANASLSFSVTVETEDVRVFRIWQ